MRRCDCCDQGMGTMQTANGTRLCHLCWDAEFGPTLHASGQAAATINSYQQPKIERNRKPYKF